MLLIASTVGRTNVLLQEVLTVQCGGEFKQTLDFVFFFLFHKSRLTASYVVAHFCNWPL